MTETSAKNVVNATNTLHAFRLVCINNIGRPISSVITIINILKISRVLQVS